MDELVETLSPEASAIVDKAIEDADNGNAVTRQRPVRVEDEPVDSE
ncbi:MAG TPA: hypothetical protein VFQ44_02170 [Streptosporangiaceae bacterium]|nr:hypothetical protein [Streptosporangiaceae bacterium]